MGEVVDVRDRVARTLCGGKVRITFPVGEAESHDQFELLRHGAGEWKAFVARGIRDKATNEVKPMDMGSMKLPFVVKTRVGADGDEEIPLYTFTYLTFHKKKKKSSSRSSADRNWSYVPWSGLAPPLLSFYGGTFGASLNHFICKLYRSAAELNRVLVRSPETSSGGGGGRSSGGNRY